MIATPNTLLKIDSQTIPDGNLPKTGHDSSATQIGKVLEIAKMSVSGKWAKAKNDPTRLQLPARLRTQRVGERQTATLTPSHFAHPAMKTSGTAQRTMATTCQPQPLLANCAHTTMQLKANPLIRIQR